MRFVVPSAPLGFLFCPHCLTSYVDKIAAVFREATVNIEIFSYFKWDGGDGCNTGDGIADDDNVSQIRGRERMLMTRGLEPPIASLVNDQAGLVDC